MANIRCGNCAQTHESVQDVRKCYAGQTVATVAREVPGITDKQADFLKRLREERGLDTSGIDKLSKQAASDEISQHLSPKGKAAKEAYATTSRATHRQALRGVDPFGVPFRTAHPDESVRGWADSPAATGAAVAQVGATGRRPTGQPEFARDGFTDVPAGHYAVPSLTGNNDLDFFRVDRPYEGRWAGRVFVKRVIGGRPNSPVRGRTYTEALLAIRAAGAAEAARRYAQELGRCSRCNRHLTDETSRAYGMGPECRSK